MKFINLMIYRTFTLHGTSRQKTTKANKTDFAVVPLFVHTLHYYYYYLQMEQMVLFGLVVHETSNSRWNF